MRWLFRGLCAWVVGAASLAACTKANPASTCTNGICTDPSHRFCDVDGVIGGVPNACVSVKCTAGAFESCDGSDALVCNSAGNSYDTTICGTGCNPASGCNGSCTPGTAISCEASMAATCGSDGNSLVHEACALGCSTTEPRCLTFTPSNGLGPALADSRGQTDVTLPAGTRIDTDTGVVQDSSGTAIQVKTLTQSQAGARPLRVFEVHSLVAADITIVGSNPVAFVSWGTISLNGVVSVRGHGSVAGPGAQTGASCSGGDAQQYQTGCGINATGAGGAGNRNPGGQGGAPLSPNGGAAQTSFSPLTGGCSGGNQLDVSGANVGAHGGGGGGAIQLVSQAAVTLADSGLIDVGAGGGQATSGGGSGGVVVIEAPKVTISGTNAGIVANGGAGGGCGMQGPDGTTTTAAAPGATCATNFSGAGGTGSTTPGTGCRIGVDTCNGTCPAAYGGGGGSVGRLRIVTADGNYATSGSPLMSIGIVTEVITPQ